MPEKVIIQINSIFNYEFSAKLSFLAGRPFSYHTSCVSRGITRNLWLYVFPIFLPLPKLRIFPTDGSLSSIQDRPKPVYKAAPSDNFHEIQKAHSLWFLEILFWAEWKNSNDKFENFEILKT